MCISCAAIMHIMCISCAATGINFNSLNVLHTYIHRVQHGKRHVERNLWRWLCSLATDTCIVMRIEGPSSLPNIGNLLRPQFLPMVENKMADNRYLLFCLFVVCLTGQPVRTHAWVLKGPNSSKSLSQLGLKSLWMVSRWYKAGNYSKIWSTYKLKITCNKSIK